MKNSFIRLLLRISRTISERIVSSLIAEAALFLIGCMIADMQKPDSYGKYTTIQYYMQIFRGCYPFTDARTEVFQVPLTWFTLMYFCIYTALLYPIRDASGQAFMFCCGQRKQSLVVVQQMSCANRVESALLCSRLLLCMRILLFTNGLSCFLPFCRMMYCLAMLLTCLLPFGLRWQSRFLPFAFASFCSFCLGTGVCHKVAFVAVSFTEFPSPFSLLCHADSL